MNKVSKALLKLLTASFFASLFSLIIAFAGNEKTILTQVFGFIAFYGTIITVWLAILHAISLIIAFVVKKTRK